jgi:hypothetical protein
MLDAEIKNNQIYPKNMFIESCYELEVSLSKDLTEEIILKAYNKFVTLQEECLRKGITPNFNMDDKMKARDYLLQLKKYS